MSLNSVALPFDPFAPRAVGDPWRSPEPDVTSINAGPFQNLLDLLRQINRTQQVAGVVLGEAGSGKTHLIKRLMKEQDLNLIFVYVHPMRACRTMFSTLLERIVTNLDCVPPGTQERDPLTQLDHIVAKVIVAALEDYAERYPTRVPQRTLKTLRNDPGRVFQFQSRSETWPRVLRQAEEFLSRRLSADRISRMVLKSLFQYVDEEKKSIVRHFLSGYVLDEEDARMLGLRFHEIDFTIEAQEERSKQILKAVGRLLSFHLPMILCFDQLENLDSPDLVKSFGRLISEIVNETENILPVSFMRPDTLEDAFNQCDQAALDRITSNRFYLEGCNLDQALEMIKARLAWAFNGTPNPPPHPFYPFQEDLLRQEILTRGNTPRDVLTKAGQLLGTAFPIEDPLQVVKDCFASEREKLLAGSRREPFCKEAILEAFSLYFEHRGEAASYRVSAIRREEPGIDFQLEINPRTSSSSVRRLDVQVETAVHGRTLIRSLSDLIQRLESGQTDLSFFIRDAGNPIPPGRGRMPRTAERLQAFENTEGGAKFYLEYNDLVDLYALVYTKNKIPSGDLSYITSSNGDRGIVEMETLHTFVRDHFASPFLVKLEERTLALPSTSPDRPPDLGRRHEEQAMTAVKLILDEPPFRFTLEQIVVNLTRRIPDLVITQDQLATAISRHSREIVQMAVTPPIYYLNR